MSDLLVGQLDADLGHEPKIRAESPAEFGCSECLVESDTAEKFGSGSTVRGVRAIAQTRQRPQNHHLRAEQTDRQGGDLDWQSSDSKIEGQGQVKLLGELLTAGERMSAGVKFSPLAPACQGCREISESIA